MKKGRKNGGNKGGDGYHLKLLEEKCDKCHLLWRLIRLFKILNKLKDVLNSVLCLLPYFQTLDAQHVKFFLALGKKERLRRLIACQ